MRATSALYRPALARPHQRATRVELWRAGVRINPATNQAANPGEGLVGYTTGSVRATLTSRVTRSLTMAMHEDRYPWRDADPFNPWGDELRVFSGVRFADGYVEDFPVFVGRIAKVSRPDNGTFQLEASDLAAEVAGAGFAKPLPAGAGAAIISEFRRLVLGGLPGAKFGVSDKFGDVPKGIIYDTDRGKALDDLAGAVGAFWYTDAAGNFVLRKIPWLQPAVPLLTLVDGPGGALTKAAPSRDRSGVYNSWTLVSESASGALPMYATEEDTNPASPIYVLGPFGRKSRTERAVGVTDLGVLRSLARQYVARSRALAQSWTAEAVPDASLELGDVLTIQTVRGPAGTVVQAVQVINGFTFPLTTTGKMPLDLRAQQPTGVPALVAARTP